jgi:hypothetical protein
VKTDKPDNIRSPYELRFDYPRHEACLQNFKKVESSVEKTLKFNKFLQENKLNLEGINDELKLQNLTDNEHINQQKTTIFHLKKEIKALNRKNGEQERKLKVFKENSNIVKNNNTEARLELDTKLNSYIEYIEETIKTLKSM